MSVREDRLEKALRRLLRAQGGSWQRGNVYISRDLADELNGAMDAAERALRDGSVAGRGPNETTVQELATKSAEFLDKPQRADAMEALRDAVRSGWYMAMLRGDGK